jgi:iron complex transport system ATP-binding protein
MISVRSLTVRYAPGARPALDGVSIDAAGGALTAVCGPNGSGKSTLVRALLGRVPHGEGEVLVDGVDVRRLAPRSRARAVAVVPQREEPAFALPVREFVALGRYAHGSLWRGAAAGDEAAIDRALRRAGAFELAERSTDALSGGEWQRVRIARALAQEARALVLDEPTTFLDVAHEMAVFELLDELAREGLAVLLVSHQLNLVARFATSLVLLHEGRVAARGTPAEVMDGPTLERVYEWPLVVTRDPAVGAPALVPLRGRGRRTPRPD